MSEVQTQTLVSAKRLYPVSEIPGLAGYGWLSQRGLRHLIFNAENRIGSGGAIVPGNGLSGAIIRVGRKVLIDLDAFDAWVETQRVSNRNGGAL